MDRPRGVGYFLKTRDNPEKRRELMAQVIVRDIRKSFGSVEVIHGVDIDIADGEFVVLVGPSGCGKSTLLRMIAGLEDITAGTIQVLADEGYEA